MAKKRALGICDRSGDKVPLKSLVPDGNQPGLRVRPDWRDRKNPQEKPVRVKERIAVDNPRPEQALDSPVTNLAETLFPGEHYFGGGT